MTLNFLKSKAKAPKEAKVNNGGGVKKFLSQLSGAFMLPISVMAVAGLFLGIGAAIASHTTGGAHTFGLFVKNLGDPVFGAMPILFTVAMIIAFTDDIGTAVFAGLVGFLVFNALQTPFIDVTTDANSDGNTGTATFFKINISKDFSEMAYKSVGSVAGITALNTSIFAGIVFGWVAAKLYNKFHTITLPSMISFFGGKRFVAFTCIVAAMPLAIIFLLVWPFVAAGLGYFGKYSGKVAGLDSFIFGFVERSLIPFGLHHVFYAPLWYTGAGGDIPTAINDWAKNSGHVITGLNGGAITVDSTNIDSAKASVIALLKIRGMDSTGAANGAFLFKTQEDIFAGTTWASNTALFTKGNINWDQLKTTADINSFITDGINQGIKAQVTTYGATNSVVGSDQLSALANTSISPISGLKDLLVSKISKAGIPLGDSFGWLAVNGSGVNTVEFTINGNADSLAIYQFLDRQADLRLGRFMQGKFAFMQFGLPAAAAAMVLAAPKENRKVALGTIFPAALTSFVTGVTEPIEFTFLFLAPALFWGFHAIMAAFSFLFMNLLHAHMGMTFSGGFLDALIYGVLPVQQGTYFWWYVPIGIVYAPIYFIVFLFAIKKWNLATPGRGGSDKLFTKADYKAQQAGSAPVAKGALTAQSAAIVAAFGGWDNITNYKNCASRLRYDVKDNTKVSVEGLKAAGAAGVVPLGSQHFQAIFGAQAEGINTNIRANIGASLGEEKAIKKTATTSKVEKTAVTKVAAKKPAAKKATTKK